MYMTWLPATWVSLTWSFCNLQLDDVTGADFENSLHTSTQSEKRQWAQCIIIICEILPREALWLQDSQTKLFKTCPAKMPTLQVRQNLFCLLVIFFLQCRLRDMTYSAPITVDIEYTRGSQVSRVFNIFLDCSNIVFRRSATGVHRQTKQFELTSFFVFLWLLSGEYRVVHLYLADHFRTSQSACTKSTFHSCDIY